MCHHGTYALRVQQLGPSDVYHSLVKKGPWAVHITRAVKFIICQRVRSHTACVEMTSMTTIVAKKNVVKLNRLFVSSVNIICARHRCRKKI